MGATELETALALLWLGRCLILTDRATDTTPPWKRSRTAHQPDSETSRLGLNPSSLATLPLAPISMLCSNSYQGCDLALLTN